MSGPSPLRTGTLLGFVFPFLVLAPSAFWGPLADVITANRTYGLMPALALLIVPGAAVGFLAASRVPTRRDGWRLAAGILLGGSLAGAFLLWIGAGELAPMRRLVMALFGGPLLAGFWPWLGALLGLASGYGRLERRAKTPAPA